MSEFDAEQLQRFLHRTLPEIDQCGEVVEAVDDNGARLRLPFRDAYMGPGQVFSGPTLLRFADTAMYAACQAMLGQSGIAVVSTMTLTFLRPGRAGDVVADARVLRRGKRLLNVEAELSMADAGDPILRASATCAVLPGDIMPSA